MTDLSFVRSEMMPEQLPPSAQVGPIRWARENLFSGISNSILTLLAIYFIYSVLSSILPWVLFSAWNSNSLDQCRQAIRESYGAGADGACWAVIRDRYHQLLFGFYPSELYWRPISAFVLMLVALAPILFNSMPRKMLWFSMIYPFLAFWLFWGGTVFLPLSVMAGFGIAAVSMWILPRFVGSLTAVIAAIILPVVWWVVLAGPAVQGLNKVFTGPMTNSYIAKMEGNIVGFQETIGSENATTTEVKVAEGQLRQANKKIADANNIAGLKENSLTLATQADELRAALPENVRRMEKTEDASGADFSDEDRALLKAALSVESDARTAKSKLNAVYAKVGRIGFEPVESTQFGGFMLSIVIGVTGITLSLPLGVFLALGRQSNLFIVKSISVGFIEFIRGVPLITLLFVASTLLNYFMPPGTNFDIIMRVMIMVTLFSSAYMAEVIRGGLAALPLGQYEAGNALGMDYWKSMRLIIMPQALKISIPSIVGIFIGLFKDTTLVSIIGLMDPLGLSNAIRADMAWNGIVWELYGFIALMFFLFCFSMGRYSMYLERKLQTGHR